VHPLVNYYFVNLFGYIFSNLDSSNLDLKGTLICITIWIHTCVIAFSTVSLGFNLTHTICVEATYVYTSYLSNVYTSYLVNVYTSYLANVYTSYLANVYTSYLANVYTSNLANNNLKRFSPLPAFLLSCPSLYCTSDAHLSHIVH